MMLGHAIGDAIGAPVEFMTRREIMERFGPDGVVGLEPWETDEAVFPRGSFTDDTQMMLATGLALLDAALVWRRTGILDVAEAAHERYLEWLETQSNPRHRRGPGRTCIEALRSGEAGSIEDPLNDSKGSGGIMRVTPVAIALEPEQALEVGAETAAITHGHPTGHWAAGAFADIAARVARGATLETAIADTRELLLGYDDTEETLDAVDAAVELYIAEVHPVEAIQQIGEGWVADEALSIALLCSLSHAEDWPMGVLTAANITGDSDTTAGMTGALLGALQGERAIPGGWISTLESSEEIGELAEEIYDEYVGRAT
jgi:ADP-ribosylglycohydrolase